MHQRSLQTACADRFQFFFIVDKTAAGAAHRVGGTEDDRVTELIRNSQRLVDTVGDFAACHLDAKAVHCLFERDTVLTALDRVDLNTDDLHIIFVQHAGCSQLRAKVQTGLTAEVRQQCVRALLFDDLFESFDVQRLDIGHVGHLGVGHDRSRIRVDEHDLVSKTSKRFARLCTGIVELAGLTDDDRAGTDDQYLVNICALGHAFLSFLSLWLFKQVKKVIKQLKKL